MQLNDGLQVQSVGASTPAAKAGVKAGDVLVGINNDEVRDQQSIYPLLAIHEPGDEVLLKLRRGEKYVEIPVKLIKRSIPGETFKSFLPNRIVLQTHYLSLSHQTSVTFFKFFDGQGI